MCTAENRLLLDSLRVSINSFEQSVRFHLRAFQELKLVDWFFSIAAGHSSVLANALLAAHALDHAVVDPGSSCVECWWRLLLH